ncbi:type III-B CRISPR module-associated Cmr3 family protein [Actinomadura livida]|uniref:CRISPR-associated protein Csx10 n=1 Tax=Actinomadura livida TaxID=79909 RepID=A0A7W7I7H9_9ACTN|nr:MULTISPECIES: type III-B CRISPR module-associated Cmr3 family protein [Actinomadura]MBB4771853.1 CRISPR-associated protein Csx10 [Actinomadura catellatispora]GGU02877.1 hypothetical protein GCM10010208_28760 [Actinomadura livida]
MTELITVTATARQALAMGRNPTAEASIPTHRHVPGSVLRGALAAAWLAENGEPEPGRPGRARIPAARRAEFAEMFEGAIRFGPLLAPGSYVAPLSVRRCKYPKDPHCAAVAVDAAFLEEVSNRCPSCDGALEAGRGEVENLPANVLTETTRVRLTDGETAAEGMLFTRQAMQSTPGRALTLTGAIAAAHGDVPDWLKQPRRVLLGGRRSTGGAADLATGHGRAEPAADGDGRIVMRLLSPAVLVDAAARPAREPDAGLLSEILGVPVTVARSWTRVTTAGGWHAASNLPKSTDLAVAAGSVFELLLPDGPPGADALRRLLLRGIGLRRAEGYGWIEIASEAWRLPASAGSASSEADEDAAARIAQVLFDSGEGRWLQDELRRFLTAWHGGDRPAPYLLDRPHLEDALHDHAFRTELTRLLTSAPPGRLRRVIDALEVRVRGVR